MSRNANGAWAVTGAGQGIGLAVNMEAARRGYEGLALVLNITRPSDFRFPDNMAVLVNDPGIRPNSNPRRQRPDPLRHGRRLAQGAASLAQPAR